MVARELAGKGILVQVALAAAYFAAAKLGLSLSVAYGNITPVWVPTGLALAAVLLLGKRVWPAVALGALLANATTDIPLWTAGVIAVGNTLEAVVGAYLLERAGFHVSFARVKDVLAFVLLGVLTATVISASFGTGSLWLAGEIASDRIGFAWSLWWFGDAVGALMAAPLLLVWGHRLLEGERFREALPSRVRTAEALLLVVLVAVASWVVFFGGRWSYPHLLFPLMVWAALRFGQRGATVVVAVTSGIAIAGTLRGSVPIGGASLVESVQILQLLMGMVAITAFVIAATLSDRHEAEEARARLRDAEDRHRRALELNDSIVQGLAVARMALEMDLEDRAEATLQDTLAKARGIVADLLRDAEERGGLVPGSLLRDQAEPTGGT